MPRLMEWNVKLIMLRFQDPSKAAQCSEKNAKVALQYRKIKLCLKIHFCNEHLK
jgi:hypothetical protein